jgi:hypothetical protein
MGLRPLLQGEQRRRRSILNGRAANPKEKKRDWEEKRKDERGSKSTLYNKPVRCGSGTLKTFKKYKSVGSQHKNVIWCTETDREKQRERERGGHAGNILCDLADGVTLVGNLSLTPTIHISYEVKKKIFGAAVTCHSDSDI